MIIRNYTPFVPFLFSFNDLDGDPYHVVVMKGTFRIDNGKLLAEQEQEPIRVADEYHGPVGTSSVKWESEIVPAKPRTDIVLNANAHSPGGRPTTTWGVQVRVGPVEKRLRVCGPRHWEYRSFGWQLSQPVACNEVPLRYEYAFGGTPRRDATTRPYEENPVGLGYVIGDWLDKKQTYPAAQIESDSDPIREIGRTHAPEGYGPIAKAWMPRRPLAGTPDDEWRRTQFPHLPLDFDLEYFNGAHPDLRTHEFLRGDESVSLEGMTATGNESFKLPGHKLFLRVTDMSGKFGEVHMPLDTVCIDVPSRRVNLVWRESFPKDRALKSIEPWMEVGEGKTNG